MGQDIQHRGPDSHGEFYDERLGVGLSHRRLSIQDLTDSGHQPMSSHSGRWLIAFNGEIYNFKSLKSKLKHIQFRGQSDTEVLVNYIDEFGLKNTLQVLDGMFAFAALDLKSETLTLARDRAGEKPLYYGFNSKQFYFASELKSFHSNPHWRRDIDPDSLALFMKHSYIPAPFTIFKNIFKLMPGTYLEIPLSLISDQKANPEFSPFAKADASSEPGLAPVHYWQIKDHIPSRPKIFKNLEEATDNLENLLQQIISEQMVSDVPLGAFLSGGVDSSTVVAIMQKISSRKIKTFSIGFTDKEFNEAPYAQDVARHLGTEHTELYVTPKEAMDVVPNLAQIYGEPFADSSQIPTYLVAQLAKKYVTVSLSGDGGDEIFGGYNRYFLASRIWQRLGGQPPLLRSLGAKSIRLMSTEYWDLLFSVLRPVLPPKFRFKNFGDKIHKVSNILTADSEMQMYLNLISSGPDTSKLVKGAFRDWNIMKLQDPELSSRSLVEKMMVLDFKTYLPEDILTKVDRATMAVSLEARVPFLDRRLIEFAWSLPQDYKVHAGQGKRILKNLLYRYVPIDLVERPKMGFGVPVGDWIKKDLNEWAESLLSESSLKSSGHLCWEPIHKLWQEHKSGHRNWQGLLWNILMYQQWHENFKNEKV